MAKPGELKIGQLVSSTAGRDTGKYYLVYALLGPTMVQVVNGEGRVLAKPKKKNVKHLKGYPTVAENIGLRLQRGERVTDDDIRKALQELIAAIEGG
jgi:ribosomal protein L14E/L6E/L27E